MVPASLVRPPVVALILELDHLLGHQWERLTEIQSELMKHLAQQDQNRRLVLDASPADH